MTVIVAVPDRYFKDQVRWINGNGERSRYGHGCVHKIKDQLYLKTVLKHSEILRSDH